MDERLDWGPRPRAVPGYTVSSSADVSTTFTGTGAGVRVSVTYGSSPDPETGDTQPLSLARRQALEHVVNQALATLARDLQHLLDPSSERRH
jgi:hypothetical protein